MAIPRLLEQLMRQPVVVFDVYRTLLDIRSIETQPATYAFLANFLSYQGISVRPAQLRAQYVAACAAAMAQNTQPYPEIEITAVFASVLRTIAAGRLSAAAIATLAPTLGLLFRLRTTKTLRICSAVRQNLDALQGVARLGIVSNTQRLFTLAELRKFDLEKYFEQIVFSSDVQVGKPNPRIFQAVAERLGVPVYEIIYVGDNLFDDIWGAQQLNMRTVWIDRGVQQTFPAGIPRPTPTVRLHTATYQKLPQVIQALSVSV